jgi:uncharacterized protein
MSESIRAEFWSCIDDLLMQPEVREMDNIRQHAAGVSCLDHCIFVSYVSFIACKRLGLDSTAAARAGLLHDMYLSDWRASQVGRFRRLVIHPKMALENADNFNLSSLEQDIILKHMWPVTLFSLPRHRESFVVNIADKICATAKMLRIYRRLDSGKQLVQHTKATPAFAAALAD